MERRDDSYVLIDEGSQNRVKLRGQPVERCELRDGDVFQVGGVEITFAMPGSTVSAPDETHVADPLTLAGIGRPSKTELSVT